MSPNSVRCFVAVEISDEAKKELTAFLNPFQALHSGLKWTKPDQWHFTLRFFAEFPSDKIPLLKETLSAAARGVRPFFLALSTVGAFPDFRKARVFWIGAGEGEGQLKELFGRLDGVISQAGWGKEERPFSSHLTLARVKEPHAAKKASGDFSKVNFAGKVRSPIDRLTLFQSELSPQGPLYTVLFEAPLVLDF